MLFTWAAGFLSGEWWHQILGLLGWEAVWMQCWKHVGLEGMQENLRAGVGSLGWEFSVRIDTIQVAEW